MYIKINCLDNQKHKYYMTAGFKAHDLMYSGKKILFSDKMLYDSFAKTNMDSIFYKDYDTFVNKVKKAFRHFMSVKMIPASLYNRVSEKYGTEEKAIGKIIKDCGINVEELPQARYEQPFGEFVKDVEGTEKEFAGMKDASKEEKLSVILTNAWTRSELRKTFKYSCRKGTEWEMLSQVWPKVFNPNIKEVPTQNLIEAYLVNSFKKDGNKDYCGKNPLERFDNDIEMGQAKIKVLMFLYKLVQNLQHEDRTLKNINYQKFRKTADTDAMAQTIEQLKENYKRAFLEFYWIEPRKKIFADALEKETAKFDEKIKLSNDICEDIMKVTSEF